MAQAKQTAPDKITPVTPRTGIDLQINGEAFQHTGDPDMPLLWFLRDKLRLTGCKYGCDDGSCGACTVLVNGERARACQCTMADVKSHEVTTVEGLAGGRKHHLHPLQEAWIAEDAILCGYCQNGWLMAAAALLARTHRPTDADIDQLPNTCRCGSQPRIRAAIKRAAGNMRTEDDS